MKKIWLFFALYSIIPGILCALVHMERSGPASLSDNGNNCVPDVTVTASNNKPGIPKNFESVQAQDKLIFNHSTFDDFSKGTVSNSGHNLFVSRNGQIRFINWFDLDNDGHPEIVVVNDHNRNENVDGFIYYNTPGRGFRSLMTPVHNYTPGFQQLEWMEKSSKSMKRLPSLGGGRTVVADLNGNGYPEILFANFLHGWDGNHFPAFIYWGGEHEYSPSRMSYLPSLSASGLAVADLSGNGRKDIVMSNAGRESFAYTYAGISYHESDRPNRGFVGPEEGTSYIYWQKAYGFTTENRSELPTEYALDVVVADLDRDGEPDIVFLQGSGSVRIFYGKGGGVDPDDYVDINALKPAYTTVTRKLLVADLNNNGWLDIFVPSAGDTSEIFWNGPEGFSEERVSRISSSDAMAAAAADFNGNGMIDLAIANFSGDSYVYWGGNDGFTDASLTVLPTNSASGVQYSDLNNNGYYDLVFSNHFKVEDENYDTPSYIYWGSEDGYHPADRDELWGFGAVDVAIGDFNRSGLNDIFLMNRISAREIPMDLFVYWGNSRSRYSEASMSVLPGVRSEATALASDITGNGHADLVYITDHGRVLNIFYGESGSFSMKNSLQIDLPFNGSPVITADLNRNGYLDIIAGSRDSNEFAVIFGNQNGFDEPVILDFGIPNWNFALGDLNGDGNLDLVFGGEEIIKILYGTEDGLFDRDNTEILQTDMYTGRMSFADFNGNGYLDILAHQNKRGRYTGHFLPDANFSTIYWNTNGSFSLDDRLELPSYVALNGSVADLNKNGHLDILIANYNAITNRELETFIYWGGPEGSYSPERMTGLPSYSPAANMVLDLNGNGFNDIVVFNHVESNHYAGLTPMGSIHTTGSFIYWGSEDGWHIGMRDHLPSVGPHNRLIAEPGDIMRRLPYEEYISAPVQVGPTRGKYLLQVESMHNFRQDIKVFIKTAGSSDELSTANWREIDLRERADDYFLYEGSLGRGEAFIQYKLRLDTGGTGTGPVVKSVSMLRN